MNRFLSPINSTWLFSNPSHFFFFGLIILVFNPSFVLNHLKHTHCSFYLTLPILYLTVPSVLFWRVSFFYLLYLLSLTYKGQGLFLSPQMSCILLWARLQLSFTWEDREHLRFAAVLPQFRICFSWQCYGDSPGTNFYVDILALCFLNYVVSINSNLKPVWGQDWDYKLQGRLLWRARWAWKPFPCAGGSFPFDLSRLRPLAGPAPRGASSSNFLPRIRSIFIYRFQGGTTTPDFETGTSTRRWGSVVAAAFGPSTPVSSLSPFLVPGNLLLFLRARRCIRSGICYPFQVI